MRKQTSTLWQNKDFLKVWFGESISLIGSQITQFALPLLAALNFQADPFQVGLLSTVGYLPFLLFSLFAGVWIDRWPRRPVLIAANLANAALLASIPLAAAFNVLSMGQLYVVAFLSAAATVFYQVAYFAYLPGLVEPGQLAEANGKMELSYSIALVSGPGIAGALVQITSVAGTILLDVFSFVISSINLLRIKTVEKTARQPEAHGNIWQEIRVGLGFILRHPLLRSLAASTGTTVFFRVAINSQLTLYAIRDLKLEPGLLGLIMAAGSFGPLLGAVVASRVNRRLGVGRATLWIKLAGDMAYLLIPLAFGPVWLVAIMLILAVFLSNFVVPIYNINVGTLNQTITPAELRGRVSASNRFLSWSSIPLGTLLGGIFGGIIGLQPTLLIAAIGVSFSFLWLYLSPVRHLENFDNLTVVELNNEPV